MALAIIIPEASDIDDSFELPYLRKTGEVFLRDILEPIAYICIEIRPDQASVDGINTNAFYP